MEIEPTTYYSRTLMPLRHDWPHYVYVTFYIPGFGGGPQPEAGAKTSDDDVGLD